MGSQTIQCSNITTTISSNVINNEYLTLSKYLASSIKISFNFSPFQFKVLFFLDSL